MKIVAVRSYLKNMALTKPYTIAYNTFSDVSLAFFEVELENGIIGYGSGSPAEDVVGETTQQTAVNLASEFVQNFVGRDIRQFQQIIFETIHHFPHLPGTQAAIDIALHDAFGKLIGISVTEFYGQKIKSLPTSVTIGIKNVEETLAEAKDYKALGFKILKVKTGLDVKEDIERVVKLKEQFGNHFKIRVDANQGYTLQDLKQFITATQGKDLELIEQPMPVGTEKELLSLSWAERKLLAADESLKDPQAALMLASNEKPFGIYNIKLMKCGGLTPALRMIKKARTLGLKVMMGCMTESTIGCSAIAHLLPLLDYVDMDGCLLVDDTISKGITIEYGVVSYSNLPGTGATLL